MKTTSSLDALVWWILEIRAHAARHSEINTDTALFGTFDQARAAAERIADALTPSGAFAVDVRRATSSRADVAFCAAAVRETPGEA